MEEIATQEFQALVRCEEVIEAGLHTFWEVGKALSEVRDRRLWAGQYENFNDYLASRWHLKPTYAGQLMLAAGIRAELAEQATPREEGGSPRFPLPDSVAGVCALRNLEPEQRVQVMEELQEQELAPTSRNIKQAVAAILPPAEPKEPRLSFGVMRNSIDALIRQTALLDSNSSERVRELFASPDDREFAIEALTRLVELLSVESSPEA